MVSERVRVERLRLLTAGAREASGVGGRQQQRRLAAIRTQTRRWCREALTNCTIFDDFTRTRAVGGRSGQVRSGRGGFFGILFCLDEDERASDLFFFLSSSALSV